MNSQQARELYATHASALAYVDVERPNGDRNIGSAFHVGNGVFVTARHVLDGNKILEIKITEPVAVDATEYFRGVLRVDVTDEYVQEYEAMLKNASGYTPLFKNYLRPLTLVGHPYFPEETDLDVAAFRVEQIHPNASVVKLGIHYDDWIDRNVWHLSDAIILGYPPVPMVAEPVLVAARAEVNTFVVPRHSRAVHFILSAIPRGGFSGGVAIHESGDALGVITSEFFSDATTDKVGFFAVLSIEAIVKCLENHGILPEIQKQHRDSLLGFHTQSGH
jgi:hypothetical protein